MPELPEVETVCCGLAPIMCGHKISRISINRQDLRIPFPSGLQTICGATVSTVQRRAKYILIALDDQQTMIVHLGMSGRMTVRNGVPEKHDHMVITLDNGKEIVFNDPRRFGLVDLAETDKLSQHTLFKHLGPEPFDKNFNTNYLTERFKNKKTTIKAAIMDQRIVVGVGNIYAAEALYTARIDPCRAAGTLSKKEIGALISAIHDVLLRAIEAGGSSLRDYVQADGELGYFQHQWAVYGKEGKRCPACKKPCIVKITQGGRSTFYCPVKQK